MEAPTYVDVEAMTCLVQTKRCTHEQLGPTISRGFMEMSQAYPDLDLAAPPMVVYTEWNPTDCEVEIAFPIYSEAAIAHNIPIKSYTACTALCAVHNGPYSGLPEAWMSLWKYVEENNIQVRMPCWDAYVVPPEPTENDAVTELYIPMA